MIRVNWIQTEDGCGLVVEGHAGYDRPGKDIVCAAVSVLVAALGDHVRAEARGDPRLSVEIRPGHAYVSAGGNRCEAFRLVYRGLSRLADTYPEHVAVAASEAVAETHGKETDNEG